METTAQDLENAKRLWTQQLYSEFDDICFRYRLRLEKPLLRIMDLSSRWGHWDPLTRTIALATRLIMENSWAIVIEIFKHEIAHQYVDEVWRQSDQHGDIFKRACRILGVESWAQRAEIHTCPKLSDLSGRELNPEEEVLLRRVERLLALARSSNEHEALAAMNKVSELHKKYHLAQLKTDQSEDFITLTIDHKLRRLPSFHARLASILTSSFPVRVIFSSLYDSNALCNYKVIEVLGRTENVKLAEYVYWFLYHKIKLLWETYQETTKVQGIAARNSYYLGILNGFETKMAKTQKTRFQTGDLASEEKALILLGEKRLDEYLAYRHPRLHTVRSSQRSRNARIYNDGIAKGKQLTIHKGLTDVKSGGTMKLLGWSRK